MKTKLLLIILLVLSFSVFAKQIDENTAKQVGQTFLLHSTKILKKSVNLDLAYKSSSNSTNTTARTQPTTFFYVFNNGANGFVIIAGDDNVTPILGYSDEGAFDPNNIPPTVEKWLDGYKSQIRYTIDNNVSATREIQAEWTNYTNGTTQGYAKASSVSPLIQTKWSQNPYENALCPYDVNAGSANGYHAVTGCPATAMAQIMKYWNYPATGTGFHSYNHSTYGTLNANFGSTNYQWSSMPNILNGSNNAVATLMYHCGVAVEMNYGPTTSGSYVIIAAAPSPQQTSENAYKTYFGYNASTLQGLKRSNYSDNAWIALLKYELDQGRPMQYAGFGSGGGHTFVCDGYDTNNYFHMNWGWGGYYDGYFQLNALNPSGLGTGGGTGGYNSNQQALIGIQPPNGVLPQNYDLAMYSDLSTSQSSYWFGNTITVTAQIANNGIGPFLGEFAAAVFNSQGHFVDFLSSPQSSTLNSNYYTTKTFTNAGGSPFIPGDYTVAVFYRINGGSWTIVPDDIGVIFDEVNYAKFKVYYSSAIETNSAFSITTNGGKLIQDSSSTVNVDVTNTGSSTFSGQYRVNLAKLDGSWAQDIQILNENNGLQNNYHYTGGINFTGAITVAPGTYLLEVAYKTQGSSSWYYAGSSNYSNPIYVIVEAPSILPDQYENNNLANQAYTLPISFSGNTAIKNTVGSNLHIGTDNDYYKINLPSGYNYTITARLNDSYNSSNGKTYSVDGLFSYSTDGGLSWSEAYDDIMTGSIVIQNGGTVYFHTAPYFAGETGTYTVPPFCMMIL